MQILPSLNSSSERLNDVQARSGYESFITNFALQLRKEKDDAKKMIESMEHAMMSRVVDKWAQPSDIIGRSAGVDTGLTLDQTKSVYERNKDDITSNMVGINEFGNLKSFDIEGNNKYLEEINVDDQPGIEVQNDYETDRSDLALVRARDLVDQLAKDYPISDDRFRAENDQFALAA